jgi:AmmeMemoRadiSam system protein A
MTAAARIDALDRAALLGVARGAILAHLGVRPAPALPEAGPLAEPRGAFVTLHVDGALRGCVGRFEPRGTLARTVAAAAISAATEDPRFRPIRAGEIGVLAVRVAVVRPARALGDPAHLRVGSHGLLVRRGWHRGALLPKIAVEQGWDAETFLKQTCLKAGLPASAYEEPETAVEVFEAEEFGEEG